MTARVRLHTFKLPDGVSVGDRVIANKRHAAAHRSTPKRRKGTVVSGTMHRDFCRVQWDGCVGAHMLHRNFFDVIVEQQRRTGT